MQPLEQHPFKAVVVALKDGGYLALPRGSITALTFKTEELTCDLHLDNGEVFTVVEPFDYMVDKLGWVK